MKDKKPICIIGGYDPLSNSFYNFLKKNDKSTIFINVNGRKIKKSKFYNFGIFELKKILNVLNKFKVNDIIFIGKVRRPNLDSYKTDGEIEKYINLILSSFLEGDGAVLNVIIKIFREKGYNVLPANSISNKFILQKSEIHNAEISSDKRDIAKSVNILNALSKYDNAQSLVCVNGHIIGIEAVEGTDELLKRSYVLRKKYNNIKNKIGILTKIPKKNQSKLIDLPVIGPKTLTLIKKSNLNGLAINRKYTIIENKHKTLKLLKDLNLRIYDVNN